MLNYKKTFNMMSLYLLASSVPMGINLVSMPLFSIYMEKIDFAIFGYYSAFNSLLFPFILFYMNHFFMREFFYFDDDGKEKLYVNMYKFYLFIPFIGATVSTIGLYLYMHLFNRDSSIPFFPYGIVSFFSIAFSGLFYIENVYLRNKRNAKGFLFLTLLNSLLGTSLSLFLVIYGNMGALGKMMGTLISSIVLFISLLVKNRNKMIKYKIDWNLLKQGLAFCTPLVFAAMLNFFSYGIDRVLLEKKVTVDELGVYAIGISISGVMSVFSSSIGNTFAPDILESLANKNFKRVMKYSLTQIAIMFVVVCTFIISAKYLIVVFTANRYVESTTVARITSLSAISAILYSIVSNIIFAYKKTKLILYTKIIGSIICFGVYTFLINRYQVEGAAIGYVCSNLIFAVIALIMLIISLKRGKNENWNSDVSCSL